MLRREMIDHALFYVSNGFRVLPLHSVEGGECTCGDKKYTSPGKHPLTSHGVKDATENVEMVRELWGKWPQANIGVATGDTLVVLDVDLPDGPKSIRELAEDGKVIPKTLTQTTGSGGSQHFFCAPFHWRDQEPDRIPARA